MLARTIIPRPTTWTTRLYLKRRQNDRLVFDGSFLQTPFSTCINQFALTTDEIKLQYGIAMTRHLVQMRNLRISHPSKEILPFDDDASGVFRHVKLRPQVAEAHAYSVG